MLSSHQTIEASQRLTILDHSSRWYEVAMTSWARRATGHNFEFVEQSSQNAAQWEAGGSYSFTCGEGCGCDRSCSRFRSDHRSTLPKFSSVRFLALFAEPWTELSLIFQNRDKKIKKVLRTYFRTPDERRTTPPLWHPKKAMLTYKSLWEVAYLLVECSILSFEKVKHYRNNSIPTTWGVGELSRKAHSIVKHHNYPTM